MQQLFVTHVEFYHPLEMSGTVNVDVVAVETQLFAGFVGQLDLHLDLDVAATQDKTELVLLVFTTLPIIRAD